VSNVDYIWYFVYTPVPSVNYCDGLGRCFRLVCIYACAAVFFLMLPYFQWIKIYINLAAKSLNAERSYKDEVVHDDSRIVVLSVVNVEVAVVQRVIDERVVVCSNQQRHRSLIISVMLSDVSNRNQILMSDLDFTVLPSPTLLYIKLSRFNTLNPAFGLPNSNKCLFLLFM